MDSLKDLQQFYETKLCDTIFQYSLKGNQTIQIRFFRESFCHLLGIQHIVKNKNFIGKRGYDSIAKEDITVSRLKDMNGAAFKQIRLRIKYFKEISNLMENGTVFRFYSARVVYPSKIAADFLLYSHETQIYLHLFLAKDSLEDKLYVPISYVPLTENDDNPQMYIEGQEFKTVESFMVIKL